MAGELGNKNNFAVPFLVSAALVFDIIAAACSSPQTAEINADKRSKTLMKWVKIGISVSGVFILVAVCADDRKLPIISGGVLAGVIMGGLYVHANHAGLSSSEGGTEG